MSGGVAYVYDEDGQFASRCNTAQVALDKVLPAAEQETIGRLRDLAPRPDRRGPAQEADRGSPPLDRLAARARHPGQLEPRRAPSSSRSSRTSTSARWPRSTPPRQPTRPAVGQGQRQGDGKAQTVRKCHLFEIERNMGKVTGFMEYERIEEGYEPVDKRLKNYKEFVIGLTAEQAKVQGARCMDCGTPFCNNGCPVNNIIPDFNDLVYHQRLAERDHGAAQHQQLPRVHRSHLPGAVRGGLRAERQRRRRSASSRSSTRSSTRPGQRAGSSRSRPRSRPARRSPSSAPARPAWPRRSSWRAPATT